MSDYKYTNDNKKVVVIGNLNSQEKIVQEIFVVDNSEVPSGEHFIVKSLHDSPVVSARELLLKKNEEILNDQEERLKRRKKEIEENSERLEKEWNKKYSLLNEVLNSLGKKLKNISEESFNLICSFLSGNITHIVTYNRWGGPEIVNCKEPGWLNFHDKYDSGLKLLTLFGRDDGTLQWKINQYSDGSGGYTEIFPFNSYESAREKLIEFLESEKELSENSLKIAKKYNYEFSREKMDKYKEKKKDNILKYIAEKNKELKDLREQINEIEEL